MFQYAAPEPSVKLAQTEGRSSTVVGWPLHAGCIAHLDIFLLLLLKLYESGSENSRSFVLLE